MVAAHPMNADRDAHTLSPTPVSSALRIAGAILWPAFAVAGMASGALWVLLDPLILAAISVPSLQISRMTACSVAFFGFWGVSSLASALTWLLLHPTAAPPASSDGWE